MTLRSAITDWRLMLAAALLLASVAPGQTTQPVAAVVKIGVTVEDIDRSVAFYTSVLDFKKVSETEVAGDAFERLCGVFGARARVVNLKLGDECIELTQYVTGGGRAIPRDSRSNDRWFQHIAIVTTDMDKAYARLRQSKVRFASSSPQLLPAWNPSAGGIRAFYFRDPDDHVVETIWFPPGKGDPKWQERNDLFAGIDHTAIVVEDSATSLAFYRDALGMHVAGTSENYGTEQEHLNNVFGAHLWITGLRAASGPGVELLEYVAPRDGRPYPADARANDLFHWQTTFSAADAGIMLRTVRGRGYRLVSSDLVTSDGTRTFLVRDPDGHAVQILEQAKSGGGER